MPELGSYVAVEVVPREGHHLSFRAVAVAA